MVKNKGKRKWYLLTAGLALIASAVYWWLPASHIETPPPADITVQFTTKRFDRDLWETRDQLRANAAALEATYGNFLPFYAEQMVQVSRANDPGLYDNLSAFLHDPYIDTVYRDVLSHYKDFSVIDKDFDKAFRFYKKYFPEAQTYDIITLVSGFKYKTALIDSAVLVGLDLYLGSSYRYYPMVDFMTLYLMRRLTAEHIVPDAMQLILEDLIPDYGTSTKMLTRMLETGKVQYALHQILPDAPDSLLFGYSSEQWDWITVNERNIWAYMLNRDILYTDDLGEVARFMNDGPFTNGLPEASPARLGAFIGYRIIAAYLEQNPEISLPALFANNNYEQIFKESAYKPKG